MIWLITSIVIILFMNKNQPLIKISFWEANKIKLDIFFISIRIIPVHLLSFLST